jgi:hypothetical protein
MRTKSEFDGMEALLANGIPAYLDKVFGLRGVKMSFWNQFQSIKFLNLALLILGVAIGGANADGWSESGLGQPIKIEVVTVKDDGSVLVKFEGLNKYFYFANKPYMLSAVLAAKASKARVRAYTTTNTGYYNTSDLWPGGIASANYMGGIQIID